MRTGPFFLTNVAPWRTVKGTPLALGQDSKVPLEPSRRFRTVEYDTAVVIQESAEPPIHTCMQLTLRLPNGLRTVSVMTKMLCCPENFKQSSSRRSENGAAT